MKELERGPKQPFAGLRYWLSDHSNIVSDHLSRVKCQVPPELGLRSIAFFDQVNLREDVRFAILFVKLTQDGRSEVGIDFKYA